ncbi:MAG: RNA polymerase factor sigma-32 [Pseudomonadota bacterium]
MSDDRDIRASAFMRNAMSAELLDAETERDLAIRWRDNRDDKALHRLVTAYMRLAISIAAKFRRYGAPMSDLVQEANIGLMKAAEKFDPDRGVRFSTYAVWWIKAQIQDYVMRNWSMVRTGSTSSQKTLFFNLRRVRAKLERENANAGRDVDQLSLKREISAELGVPLRDVEMMDARLSGSDFSLNATQATDEGREWIETIEDDGPQVDEIVGRDADRGRARGWLADAFTALTDREREILKARKLQDEPETLESIGQRYNLSKERIRQLEAQALRKMRERLTTTHGTEIRELVAAI